MPVWQRCDIVLVIDDWQVHDQTIPDKVFQLATLLDAVAHGGNPQDRAASLFLKSSTKSKEA
ncbi:hypothetical protein LYNGBM3L_22690 [Moorena producens 3L]|uniref:Uncharacterized protein n=1 Tax=Moorena producens 3L TaxID=489825 RepID=F4XMS1_9CYAN|nr:hypothetical protein LYNGBM3L_22690 [Moorena producens 3L]